jgi:hypothetical protein
MTVDSERVGKLREMVRAAKGPDREIDVELACILEAGKGTTALSYVDGSQQRVPWSPNPWGGPTVPLAAYTSSIDAAVALVERVLPGFGYMIRRHETTFGTRACCSLLAPSTGEHGDTWDVWAATTPLAILDALLTALLAQAQAGPTATGEG